VEGVIDGRVDGTREGTMLGSLLGRQVGTTLGSLLGTRVGTTLGSSLGMALVKTLGLFDGYISLFHRQYSIPVSVSVYASVDPVPPYHGVHGLQTLLGSFGPYVPLGHSYQSLSRSPL
jgi:hypothetical protein